MPHVLETHGRALMTLRPQDGNQLSKCTHGPAGFSRTIKECENGLPEQLVVRPSSDEERRKESYRVYRNILIRLARGVNVHAARDKPIFKRFQMRVERDDDDTFFLVDPVKDEFLQRVEHRSILVVKVDEMLAGRNLTPKYAVFLFLRSRAAAGRTHCRSPLDMCFPAP